jgi:hypothetical protein
MFPARHCERSEAIQISNALMLLWIATAAKAASR